MPEGPEIRRAADRLQSVLAGQRMEQVFLAFESLKPWCERLQGSSVISVDTIGKHMLVRFDSGLRLYSHNQLYGRWFVQARDQYPDTARSLRVGLHTRRHSALLYSASAVDVIREDDLGQDPRLASLGPDPLHAALDPALVRDRFDDPRFRRRQLAGLLLDQRFFAGLGNYLRSEVLFAAGVHPLRRPVDCTPQQLQGLADAILRLTRRSYRTGGITNSDTLVKRLRADGVSREALRFRVFAREGQGCYCCGQEIVRETMGGRRAYFCARCQPLEDV